jgi:putative hydrolase of the HAD superfamily
MTIKAIVFDFGNVIAFFDHYKTLNRIARYTDMTPQEMYDAIYNGSLEDDFERGRITITEFLARFRQTCRLNCDDEVLHAACADIFRPNPDVCGLLPALKPSYRLVLGSNTNELHGRTFRRQFGDVLGLFDAIVVSYEIGVRKPHAGFFDHCRRQADCPPNECLFIDDMPGNVAGARACGWQGLVYTGITELRQGLRARGVDCKDCH